ncbi:MAG: hypothetical protein ACRC5T_11020 [Cetobacterium sp.]
MKQLTKNEIIEVRARAVALTEMTILEYDEIPKYNRNKWYHMAISTIEADEQAGVLILVDDEPKEGDLVVFGKLTNYFQVVSEKIKSATNAITKDEIKPLDEKLDNFWLNSEDCKIIQRNNTPCYIVKD